MAKNEFRTEQLQEHLSHTNRFNMMRAISAIDELAWMLPVSADIGLGLENTRYEYNQLLTNQFVSPELLFSLE